MRNFQNPNDSSRGGAGRSFSGNPSSEKGFYRQQSAGVAEYDEGLRAYMLKVFNHMGLGLVVTGLVAFFVASNESLMMKIYTTPLRYLVMFAPFAFVLVIGFGINRLSQSSATLLFYLFSAVMGLSISSIFIVYEMGSIARVFFITAATFGATSLYGYTTKRDLTSLGSFLIMGLFGVIIASIVNIFFIKSSGFDLILSYIAVPIFIGLIAYDSQKIKENYYIVGKEFLGKAAIIGSLSLYLDFINLFLNLLRIMGERR